MSRMTKQNLDNIKDRFTARTGVELNTRPGYTVRKLAVLAAAVICCLALAAFTYPLFTPLNGDELSLCGTYEGDGVVSVYVENGSDRDLEFQEQAKLVNWFSGEEEPNLDGKIRFENTSFPAHSSGIMTVDLSEAYDIEALERDGKNYESYYLLLTNNGFLFGHDWMCSFTFAQKKPVETEPHVTAEAQPMEDIAEELRFYFEDSYQDAAAGLNDANFAYLQKVDEVIKRFEGNVVAPLYPLIPVTGPATFLAPHPQIWEEGEDVSSDWTIFDGYRRLVGGTMLEKALTVSVNIPLAQSPDGYSSVPLVYTFVFDAEAVQPDSYAFVYGQFRSFAELEDRKVYQDGHYAIYNITDYLYTDLDAYIDFLQETRSDLSIDDTVRRRIHEIYNHYQENMTIEYMAIGDDAPIP